MIRSIVNKYLKAILEEVFQNVDSKSVQLSMGADLFSESSIKLEELTFRPDLFDAFLQPLHLVSGHLGKVTVEGIAEMAFGGNLRINIENAYLLFSIDSEASAEHVQFLKKVLLEMQSTASMNHALIREILCKLQHFGLGKETEINKKRSVMMKMANLLFKNVSLAVYNLHVRLETPDICSDAAAACDSASESKLCSALGLTLPLLKVSPSSCAIGMQSRAGAGLVLGLVMKGLQVYCDYHCESYIHAAQSNQSGLSVAYSSPLYDHTNVSKSKFSQYFLGSAFASAIRAQFATRWQSEVHTALLLPFDIECSVALDLHKRSGLCTPKVSMNMPHLKTACDAKQLAVISCVLERVALANKRRQHQVRLKGVFGRQIPLLFGIGGEHVLPYLSVGTLRYPTQSIYEKYAIANIASAGTFGKMDGGLGIGGSSNSITAILKLRAGARWARALWKHVIRLVIEDVRMLRPFGRWIKLAKLCYIRKEYAFGYSTLLKRSKATGNFVYNVAATSVDERLHQKLFLMEMVVPIKSVLIFRTLAHMIATVEVFNGKKRQALLQRRGAGVHAARQPFEEINITWRDVLLIHAEMSEAESETLFRRRPRESDERSVASSARAGRQVRVGMGIESDDDYDDESVRSDADAISDVTFTTVGQGGSTNGTGNGTGYGNGSGVGRPYDPFNSTRYSAAREQQLSDSTRKKKRPEPLAVPGGSLGALGAPPRGPGPPSVYDDSFQAASPMSSPSRSLFKAMKSAFSTDSAFGYTDSVCSPESPESPDRDAHGNLQRQNVFDRLYNAMDNVIGLDSAKKVAASSRSDEFERKLFGRSGARTLGEMALGETEEVLPESAIETLQAMNTMNDELERVGSVPSNGADGASGDCVRYARSREEGRPGDEPGLPDSASNVSTPMSLSFQSRLGSKRFSTPQAAAFNPYNPSNLSTPTAPTSLSPGAHWQSQHQHQHQHQHGIDYARDRDDGESPSSRAVAEVVQWALLRHQQPITVMPPDVTVKIKAADFSYRLPLGVEKGGSRKEILSLSLKSVNATMSISSALHSLQSSGVSRPMESSFGFSATPMAAAAGRCRNLKGFATLAGALIQLRLIIEDFKLAVYGHQPELSNVLSGKRPKDGIRKGMTSQAERKGPRGNQLPLSSDFEAKASMHKVAPPAPRHQLSQAGSETKDRTEDVGIAFRRPSRESLAQRAQDENIHEASRVEAERLDRSSPISDISIPFDAALPTNKATGATLRKAFVSSVGSAHALVACLILDFEEVGAGAADLQLHWGEMQVDCGGELLAALFASTSEAERESHAVAREALRATSRMMHVLLAETKAYLIDFCTGYPQALLSHAKRYANGGVNVGDVSTSLDDDEDDDLRAAVGRSGCTSAPYLAQLNYRCYLQAVREYMPPAFTICVRSARCDGDYFARAILENVFNLSSQAFLKPTLLPTSTSSPPSSLGALLYARLKDACTLQLADGVRTASSANRMAIELPPLELLVVKKKDSFNTAVSRESLDLSLCGMSMRMPISEDTLCDILAVMLATQFPVYRI